MASAKKAMIIGIDSAIATRLYNWAQQGRLPNLKAVMDRGVYAKNCLVPFPTVTPPNWTTIATGAWCGTHSINYYQIHTPGQPLWEQHNGFSDDNTAEYLWNSVARDGKSAIVVNWPASYPFNVKNGCQIAGFGLGPTDWQYGYPAPYFYRGMLAVDALLTTDVYLYGTQIDFTRAAGWTGVEHSAKALNASAEVEWRRPRWQLEPVKWHVLVDSSDGKGFDTVVVAKSKDKGGVYARLKVGEWSPNLYETFQTEIGPQKAVFRLKLVELSPDAQALRLYVVGPSALQGWGHPAGIEAEITSEEGMPTGKSGWEGYNYDWIDAETLLKTQRFQNIWLADASLQLLKSKPWDVFFIHLHATDWLYHIFTTKLDPLTADDPSEVDKWQDVERRFYEDVDEAVGQILTAADDETVVVITSDHGAKTQTALFDVNDILVQAGLLYYLPWDGEEEAGPIPAQAGHTASGYAKAIKAAQGLKRVDWSKTKAVGLAGIHVYVNLKGRDPDGIVDEAEYPQVVRQVIDALSRYVDPQVGLRPIALALSKEDARNIGHWGERTGDVVYAVNPEFGREHSQQLTTARYGIGDLRGLFIMAGPGVKQGEVIERNVWLTDIVPTVCHLTGLPLPAQCEGAVVYQALIDPDAGSR